MKIKFEMLSISPKECLTKCPMGKLPKVNSVSCRNCEDFISVNIKQKYINCRMGENSKPKEINILSFI